MSRNEKLFRNVPPPPGSKGGATYARFIPREELGDAFAAWKPGNIGEAGAARPAAASPAAPAAEPTSEEWRAQVHAARHAGYQDGYRDGLVALENFKQNFAAQAYAQVGTLLQSFEDQLDALEQQMAGALANSAVQLARHLIRAELRTQPEVVARVAAEAVSAVLLSARQISVHLHPEDHAFVVEGAAEAIAARGARLVEDIGVERGGCLVVSDAGTVDARMATRWAQAAASLGSTEPWAGGDDAP